MSDVKISGLPSSTGVTPASDYIPIVHNGTTEKITLDQLLNGLPTSSVGLLSGSFWVDPYANYVIKRIL